MTKLEIIKKYDFDEAFMAFNPYFFGNEYEEKGVLVLFKFKNLDNHESLDTGGLCFQCPSFVSHPNLDKMILFLFDKDNYIYDYSIAGSADKIKRSEIVIYEELLGEKID